MGAITVLTESSKHSREESENKKKRKDLETQKCYKLHEVHISETLHSAPSSYQYWNKFKKWPQIIAGSWLRAH